MLDLAQVAKTHVPVSFSQVVLLSPGEAGVNAVVPVVLASAAVGAVQAFAFGAATVMPGVWMAATAEFMYAFASAWQAPLAERMR